MQFAEGSRGGTSLHLTFIILGALLSILYVVGFVLIGWLWKLSSVSRVPRETPAALPAAVAVSRRRLTEGRVTEPIVEGRSSNGHLAAKDAPVGRAVG